MEETGAFVVAPLPSSTTPQGLQPDDVRLVATLSYETLAPVSGADWHHPAGGLEWDCRRTLEHLVYALDRYSLHLATPSQEPAPPALNPHPDLGQGELLTLMRLRAGVLAAVTAAAAPTARGFHRWGRSDPPGYIAMACAETLLHTDDIGRGLGQALQPPEALCRRVLERLFPWAPTDVDPWAALRWAAGRLDLPGYGQTLPTWAWHASPLTEWDGTVKIDR